MQLVRLTYTFVLTQFCRQPLCRITQRLPFILFVIISSVNINTLLILSAVILTSLPLFPDSYRGSTAGIHTSLELLIG